MATPATPLANGGAFGGKVASPAADAARELADETGRTVRAVYSREDVVRLGPKRPPIAASAVWDDGAVRVRGVVAGEVAPFVAPIAWPYELTEVPQWSTTAVPGPATSSAVRAVGLAERAVLVEGALHVAGVDRLALTTGARAAGGRPRFVRRRRQRCARRCSRRVRRVGPRRARARADCGR